MNNEGETITVTIRMGDVSVSSSVDFVPDGLNHEKPMADAVTAAIAAMTAIDGNTCLSMVMTKLAQQYVSPLILQAAGWAFGHSDLDDRDQENWDLTVHDHCHAAPHERTPRGVRFVSPKPTAG